ERDRIISVGDFVDRGPESLQCLRLLRQPWFHAVQGNHENMMLASIEGGEHSRAWNSWMMNGGEWFDGLSQSELAETENLLDDLARVPLILTLHTRDGLRIGVCHAQPPRLDWLSIGKGEDLTEAELWDALWGRDYVYDYAAPT